MSAARVCIAFGALLLFAIACGHYGPPRRSEAVAAPTLQVEETVGDAPAQPKPEKEEQQANPSDRR